MPIWGINRATINGPSPVIDEIKLKLTQDDPGLLAWMVPQPRLEGDQDWYQWCVNNWGTKWDICDTAIIDDQEEDSVTFEFSTAWSPPVEAFHTWAAGDGRVEFKLDYWESGVGYIGTTTYDGEYLDTDDVDANTDQDRYRTLAAETWGYVEWDDPEPLTEWYKEGVEAKGLTNGI